MWLPNRFRRIPARDGIELIDSSQIFEVNPDYARRVAISGISDPNDGFVSPGWLMVARSGQIYGLLGSVTIATKLHAGKIVSDDVIRIVPGEDVLAGYLYVAMGHALLGRGRVKSLAYGSSIPHIEVDDLKELAIPRLDRSLEKKIAELVESAFFLWAQADEMEKELSCLAEDEIQRTL